LVRGPDGVPRCWWVGDHADYRRYHDEEWGWPVSDDQRLFEKLCLEGFQAGLSWLTVLRKRAALRRAFSNFDIDTVAGFGPKDVERLMTDPALIRHRGKIESAIDNARRARALISELGSLAAYFWRYEPPPERRPRRLTYEVALRMTQSEDSRALSRDLKRRGFTFVGPTTAYAFMQAMGIVNDHLDTCAVRARIERQRATFRPPSG
jgi:DNA-3-methyladenine glycosylase I